MGKQTRYFPLQLPLAADTKSAAAVRFAYVDPGHASDTELRSWGKTHRHLWGVLRKKGFGVHVVAIGPNHRVTMRAETVLRSWLIISAVPCRLRFLPWFLSSDLCFSVIPTCRCNRVPILSFCLDH